MKNLPCLGRENGPCAAAGAGRARGRIPRRIRPNPPNADGPAEKRFPCAPVRGWPPRGLARAFGEFAPAPTPDSATRATANPLPANRAKIALWTRWECPGGITPT